MCGRRVRLAPQYPPLPYRARPLHARQRFFGSIGRRPKENFSILPLPEIEFPPSECFFAVASATLTPPLSGTFSQWANVFFGAVWRWAKKALHCHKSGKEDHNTWGSWYEKATRVWGIDVAISMARLTLAHQSGQNGRIPNAQRPQLKSQPQLSRNRL